MISHLERLIGRTVRNTDMGTSTTYAIGKSQEDPDFQINEIELRLFFEDYYLNIYNPITIIPADKELLDFVGLKVIAVNETEVEAELFFDNGHKMVIDLSDEVYHGPEAMSLTGRDDFCAVWS
jgi:hypothetical protein